MTKEQEKIVEKLEESDNILCQFLSLEIRMLDAEINRIDRILIISNKS